MQDFIGKQLGKYEIVEKVGEGGMAQVYKAFQPGPDRYVAIKVMHGSFIKERGFQDRFQREARAIARLSHPNIVRIFDFDLDGNIPYMIMEFIDGSTLKELQGTNHMVLEETQDYSNRLSRAVELCDVLADAIDYAHRQRVIHRDLKPSNIMISQDNQITLMDFGLAQIKDSVYETSNAFVGTPAYVSPELAQRIQPITQLTDIYSLGVIIYELLSGQTPFEGNIDYLLRAHMEEKPPSIYGFSPEISHNLDMVMQKVLAKTPENRFQTATAFASALRWVQMGLLNATPLSQHSSGLDDMLSEKVFPEPAVAPANSAQSISSHAPYLEDIQTGDRFQISGRYAIIGCSSGSDIDLTRLPKSEVTSRKHANIWRKSNGEYWIKDEHSTNGTIVNGHLLAAGKRTQLKNGAEIQFGQEGPVLRFRALSA